MDDARPPAAALRERRAAFAELVLRADLAPAGECERLLNEAVTLAHLHRAVTRTPLVPDLDAYPGLAERLPRHRAPADRSTAAG